MIMNKNEQVYLDLLRDVLENGQDRPDRTGTGTRSVFGRQVRYDLQEGFPLLTTKKIDLRSVSSELLWFIEGSGDERRLAEIRYGKPRGELVGKKTIWTDNAHAPYWIDKARYAGDAGRIYGVQWRSWRTYREYDTTEEADRLVTMGYTLRDGGIATKTIDQLANLIDGLRNDPYGRRHILTAWNPGELDDMALPPCHILSMFYVQDGKLSCKLVMRSNDNFLGNPYNVASYALLTHMIAQVCGYEVDELVVSTGDTHIYHNHFDAVNEQLTRTPRVAPKIILDTSIQHIDDFNMDSFELIGYDPHPAIKAPMAV